MEGAQVLTAALVFLNYTATAAQQFPSYHIFNIFNIMKPHAVQFWSHFHLSEFYNYHMSYLVRIGNKISMELSLY